MRRLSGWMLVVFVAACSGGKESGSGAGNATGPEPAMAQEGTSGGEASSAAESPPPAEAPAPQGDAHVTVRIVVDGQQVPGEVQVLDGQDHVVAKGASGDTLAIPGGAYVFVGKVGDASVMVDKPSHRTDSEAVAAGETRSVDVEMGRAKVRLKVLKGNRPLRAVHVELKHQGSEEAAYEYVPGNDYIYISPGRYDAVLHMPDKSEVRVDGLVFMAGATQDIPVRVQ